ncbi:B3 domain-containing protein Os03g0620500-like isoform X2 [Cornus florida]|uniref:B3 domain-containing protein Os03g0620500-like isoform X2 n=1 Tax=Cornus florida TaxID=4283 RepID=UPI00289E763D|nr:B3 domain-containing protein Os03g0620500-like isoform X2 [Cornus florida]
MLNAKRPHFLEAFNSSLSSQLLKIPSKFIKHMGGTTSGSVSLVGPSGSTWHVDLIQHSDCLFFHDGWAAFVKDHFIEHGDSLVFRYDGNLHFTVQVFDKSSCEKEAAFTAICSQDPSVSDKHMGRKREGENRTSCLDDIIESIPKKRRGSQVHVECITLANIYQAAAPSVRENCDSVSKNSLTLAMPLQSIMLTENSEVAVPNGTNKEDELVSCASGCMPLLSAAEAEKVARSFTSSFPNFVKIMKRFNVGGSYTLNIPYQFSMEHLPKCKVKIVLHNLKGESWIVNSIPTTRVQTSHTFCGGWMAFVRDNNIEMGDICIFELVRKCEMRVQIFGVGKRGVDCSSGKAGLKGLNNGCGATSHKISQCVPKKISHNANLQRKTMVEVSDKKESDHERLIKTKSSHEAAFSNEKVKHDSASKRSAYSQSKACNGKQVIQTKVNFDEKQGSLSKVCMSMKSAPEEKRAAQSFISSLPHFVRIMKKFNISGSYTLFLLYRKSRTSFL